MPPDDPLVGTTVSHFEILERLGAGGMGVVYRARDVKLDRPVALKFLHPGSLADDTAKRRFMAEAKVVSALDHPNVCTVYEVDETDGGGLFIAMAFYEGTSLRERLEEGPLPVEEALDYAEQVAVGLSRAHAEGIVHRDIKPANLMIAGDLIKIVDFGVAKRQDLTLTEPGAMIGTAAYMSPEQMQGEPVDPRTDVWSLGVVLYEMLAGTLPFDSPHIGVLIHSVLTEDPEPIRQRRSDLPDALEGLLEKTLEKRPDERYGSMDELLADLRSVRASPTGVPREPPAKAAPERHVVGRDAEIGALREALASAAAGHGLLVCVAGEPGIGKTTLVTEFLEEAARGEPPASVAEGQCSERLLGTEPYLPFLEALSGLLKADGSGTLEAVMRERAPLWYVQVASLSSQDPDDVRLLEETRSANQERMKREVVAFLEAVARTRPLILFIEDLHWADVSTVDLLAHVSTKLEDLRLLVVATYRPADMALADHPFLEIRPDLLARGVCRELVLDFLARDDVERYLELEYPDHAFPPAFSKLIYDTSEGSPLFMADLLQDLRRREVIAREDGRWVLTDSPELIEIGLPQSVQGMVQYKVTQVEDEDRDLLVAAAVQGYEFDSAVIAEALSADPEVVEERLDALERDHRLVRLLDEREFPDRSLTLRYRFVHALYQNEFYGSLKPTKRVRLSRAVAEALEGRYGGEAEAVAAELAMLFEAAREPGRAVEYYALAAQHALRRFAFHETLGLARRGLGLIGRLPDSTEKLEHELDLLLPVSAAAIATRGFGAPEAHEALERSHELCRELDSDRLFFVSSELAMSKQAVAAYPDARKRCEEVLRLAENDGDETHLMQAHTFLGSTLFYTGRWESARQHLEEGFLHYDPGQHAALGHLTGDMGVYNLCTQALNLWILGYPDQAVTRIREARALAEELRHPFSIGFALGFGGNVHHGRRDVDAVKEHGDRGIAHATENGFPHWVAQGRMQLGWALAHLGRADEGLPLMHEGWDGWRATGIKLAMVYWPCWMVEAYAAGGRADADEVRELLDEAAAALAAYPEEGLWAPEVSRLRGEHVATGDEAEACIREALDLSRERSAKSWELRAATSLARHLMKRDEGREARALLRETYDWFTEGFDTPDLQDARALLDELG